ncbi:MAG TPA: hypothetical protein VGC79_13315, partial [Polyangiaceae bacterium]
MNSEVKVDDRKTIRKLAQRWINWKREVLANDRKAYEGAERTLNKWVLPFAIADIDLERELNLGHCTDWIEGIKKAGRAPMTTRNIVQQLRGFLVDVRGKGWVNLRENPFLDPYVRKVLGVPETIAGRNCHGSAYEIRVRSPKRIQSGSAKQSHLRSAKRIHLAGVETAKNGGPDR